MQDGRAEGEEVALELAEIFLLADWRSAEQPNGYPVP